ncbi:MAG: M55 family metallopeptidase [Gemmatimonadota bacterium]|nr:M55 family metallopeptidase [Gemmatimonadota bacterium]MDE2864456.1 M55 family metallopeptidase [Gemmatimonadota bacterium]
MQQKKMCGSATLFPLVAAISAGAVACAPAGEGGGNSGAADDSQVATGAAQLPAEPWTLEDVTPITDDGIRVLIIHDMEGLSGQDDPRSYRFGTEQYPSGQEMLAADVNAVVDGLFAGGATDVVIADGHGSGNSDPDLRTDLLDGRATQIIRDEPFDTYFDLPESEAIDAVAVVGMHSKTGSGGFAAHTFTLGIDLLINGQSITETELVALSWGRFGVPVIFASGDDKLRGDLETMPWIEYVTVKDAPSADSAITRPVEEARADLREGARRAVELLAEAKSLRVSGPVRASLRAVPPATLRFLEGVPGIDYSDDTYSFVAADMREAYDGLVAVVGMARVGYQSLLQEVVAGRPDAGEIMSGFSDALWQRWHDQESGRYARPEAGQALGEMIRRFHGYR